MVWQRLRRSEVARTSCATAEVAPVVVVAWIVMTTMAESSVASAKPRRPFSEDSYDVASCVAVTVMMTTVTWW